MKYIEVLKQEMEEIRKQLVPWFGEDISVNYDAIYYGYEKIVLFDVFGAINNYGYAYKDLDFSAKDVFENVGINLQEIKVKPRPQKFAKDMLTNGDLVQFKNGGIGIYLENTKSGNTNGVDIILHIETGRYNLLDDYKCNLQCSYDSEMDIVKVCSNDYVGNNFAQYKNGKINWS